MHPAAMQSVTTHSPVASQDREGIPVFSVVIVFEDFNTGKRAKRAYDFLVANLTREWRVISHMWKFEVLGIPELREMAANDAAIANLIIVSSRGDRELPADVKDWIEMWQGDKGEPVALVALFDQPPELAEHAQTTQAYLERVAKRERMEFFTWPEVGLAQQSRRGSLVPYRRPGVSGGPLLPPVVVEPRDASFSHWSTSD
jgi:hypothetical protein